VKHVEKKAHAPTSVDTADTFWAHIEPESSRDLLLASLDAFAANGFAAATTREIAKRAGLSPAAVYVHYRSKMDLLLEISRVGHVSVLAAVDAAIAGVDDPAEALRLYVVAFTAWHAHNHTLARIAQYELSALQQPSAEDIRGVRDQFLAKLSAILRKGKRRHQFEVSDVHSTGRAILSLGIDVSRWYQPDGPLSPDDIGRLYGELAVRMVRAMPAAAS
jgi:AcrR family transcriptional regulator